MPLASDTARHTPVLRDAVVRGLAPRDGGIYVDGTFGAGGYTAAILDAADCVVAAIDRDPDAIAAGRETAARRGGRLVLIEGPFADMEDLLRARGIGGGVDGVAFDLGVSSMQLGAAGRGFSFRLDGPLDMRMEGPEAGAPSAADIVNTHSESDIARIIAVLGGERRARAVARAVVRARAGRPLTRTLELAGLIAGLAGGKARRDRIHPATRTFQALRIHVNRELEQLCGGLRAAEVLLRPGGRIAVVSFHSLEDRIVKRFLAERSGRAHARSRHMPDPPDARAPSFAPVSRGAQKPDDEEIRANPRARSARLRVAERTDAPAFPFEPATLGLPAAEARGR